MARIPRVVRTVPIGSSVTAPRVNPAARGREQAASAAIGAGGAAIGERILTEEERLERKNEVAAENAWLDRRTNDIRQNWMTRFEQLKQSSEPGAPDFTKNLLEEFDEYISEIESEAPSERLRLRLGGRVAGIKTSLQADSMDFEAKSRLTERARIIDESTQLRANMLLSDPSKYVELEAELMGMINDNASVLGQTATEKARKIAGATLAESTVKGEITDNPRAALKRLNDGVWDEKVDATTKSSLINSAQAEINRQETRAEGAAKAYLKAVNKRITDAETVIEAGGEPTNLAALQAEIDEAPWPNDEAKATAQQRLDYALEDRDVVRAFALLRPEEQQTRLTALRAQITEGSDARTVRLEEKLIRTHTRTVSGLKQDAMAYASTIGLIDVLEGIDFSDPASFSARSAQAEVVAAYYGRPVSPFTKDETSQFSTTMNELDSMGQLAFIQRLQNTISADQLKVVASSVAGDMPAFAVAAAISVEPGMAPTAREVLRGQQVLKQSPEMVESNDALNQRAMRVLGDAFRGSPVTRRAYIDGATAWAASMIQREGKEGDKGSFLNYFEEGLKLLAGGVQTGDQSIEGGPFEFNDAYLIPPIRGMTKGQFEDVVETLTPEEVVKYANGMPQDIDGNPISLKHLEDAQYETVGDGRYLVRFEDSSVDRGLGYAQGENKQPWVIDMKRLLQERGTE